MVYSNDMMIRMPATMNTYRNSRNSLPVFLLALACVLVSAGFIPAEAQTASEPVMATSGASNGQTVYIPIYSHIFFGDTTAPFDLTGTLSIRNTDMNRSIMVVSAKYFDSDGKLVRDYFPSPVLLGPLASTHCIVPESDRSGGVGASFVVRWRSASRVSPPLIEAVMIGTRGQQGISFISRGQVLSE